ncbi:MAG: sodium/glutamate symporter [Microcystis panniformis Mp_MB_F_20051200_S9]|uniref:Sodium/glutamate symporter n=1 Tax=Microcystis panniformis Mp_MB_F_20051200_S9 TaxID=2486223 RepID=A0A552Q735_9CHRO|nr:MAG: sodium/glutamate symporter [Microcystis panniformis Mp_GB_SS_20050300_S99]TRV49556.1 MAG: sodium/glutamate symporter [Microcystis panniformis Mp_GB_SS_20050300_S99D]TRV51602.1 MAG: sodium/glutamate symporter [Microcystis panniformis Mp_MB_F_20080800_S26D]TRV58032.1 MAG: sodium/glutamate symporter [Microcystis panniformis Mp_MB_F_20051200_S9D]TRV58696.1 MAG: sodium/glutamate symporter [Microcystis panniformis Mp_MB_F_20080800_S26]TRV65015.1 MAG: sodium/glutamate symporter [Microcystis p
MEIYQFSERQTIIIAILVLYLGKYLSKNIKFLQDYNIPDAVTGGVLASLFFGLFFAVFKWQIEFTLNVRDALLIVFFTTIGLSSKLKTLLQGGKPLLILLITAVVYLILQNLAGLGVAKVMGLDLPIGLIAGSVSLSGGHGTAIAWAPIFRNNYGIVKASEIGVASATFGLVLGGIIGGPVARWLITRNRLRANNQDQDLTVGIKQSQRNVNIDYNTMLHSILVIGLTIGLGIQINYWVTTLGLKLPDFVTCLLAGIILTNTIPLVLKRFPWPANTPSLALISDVSLGLFLSMSLMSLQLWTLIDLAGPIAILLLVQFSLSIIYTVLLVFPLMGKNYHASVVCAGYLGLTLGATPTAIANMTAVTEHFGASPQAFIIVPLVGAFFIDLFNAFIIQQFLNFLT